MRCVLFASLLAVAPLASRAVAQDAAPRVDLRLYQVPHIIDPLAPRPVAPRPQLP